MVKYIVLNEESLKADSPKEFTLSFKKHYDLMKYKIFNLYEMPKIKLYSSKSFIELELAQNGKTLYDFYSEISEAHDWITLISSYIDTHVEVTNDFSEIIDLASTHQFISTSFSHNEVYCNDIILFSIKDIVSCDVKNIYDDNSLSDTIFRLLEYKLHEDFSNPGFNIINKCGENKINVKTIEFHKEFTSEFRLMQKKYQKKVVSIFTNFLLGEKFISDYEYHDESESVKNNPSKTNERKVYFQNKDMEIFKHLKLDKDVSVYLEIQGDVLFVGKFTKHLSTKKH